MQNIPSLYQDHFRVFCDCSLSQLKDKYTNNWEVNIKFTNWYLARSTRLRLSESKYGTPSVIRHLASMQDNQVITNTFRLLLNKTDEALIISKAAMFCLQHLCDLSSTREAAHRHLRVSKVDRNYRKTRPWRWHQRGSRRDLARKVFVKKWVYIHGKLPNSLTTYEKLFAIDNHAHDPIYPLHLFSCIYGKSTINHDHKAEPFYKYRGFLEYLVIILPRAGNFLPLIQLCKTKPFALMSMMFPDLSQKARRAMQSYLDRVEAWGDEGKPF